MENCDIICLEIWDNRSTVDSDIDAWPWPDAHVARPTVLYKHGKTNRVNRLTYRFNMFKVQQEQPSGR